MERDQAEGSTPDVPPMSQFAPLMMKIAWTTLHRARASRIPLELEDIQQELALTYVQCAKAFRPDVGAKFMTFFFRAALNNVRTHLLLPFYKRNVVGLTISGDSTPLDSEDGSMWDALPGHDPRPDQCLEGEEMLVAIMEKLSPLARALVAMRLSDPEIVYDQLEALNKGAEEIRAEGNNAEGYRSRGYPDTTFTYLGKLFGVSRRETTAAQREIESAARNYLMNGA